MIYSKRNYRCVWLEGGKITDINLSLNTICEGSEMEFNYALQDDIDTILDMPVGKCIYFQFNRDNEGSKGIILRIN